MKPKTEQTARPSAVRSHDLLGEQVVELYLCESRSLVLKPNTLYRFIVDPNCKICNAIAAESSDLYSPNEKGQA